MAAEAKRGCGYRKVGGLYLVADGLGSPCCKMPLELTICPCCGGGIKQARGWTWVDAGKLFPSGGCKADPLTMSTCPAVNPALMGRAGLIWIGEKFYKRPLDFAMEAKRMGISRRLHNVPREFKAGETWVFFAHPKAIEKPRRVVSLGADQFVIVDPRTDKEEDGLFAAKEDAEAVAASRDLADPIFVPGVVFITKPRGFEKIVKQSDYDRAIAASTDDLPDLATEEEKLAKTLAAQMKKDAERGIKWVPVPDDDPDHKGTVYDDEEPAPAGREETA